MSAVPSTKTDNGFISVLAGIAGTFITGLIFYPVMDVLLDRYFSFGPRNTTHELILNFSFCAWVFLAAIGGGIICALVSKNDEYRNAWLLFGIAALLLIVLDKEGLDTGTVIMIASLLFGYLTGTRAGKFIKHRKALRKQTTFEQDLLHN